MTATVIVHVPFVTPLLAATVPPVAEIEVSPAFGVKVGAVPPKLQVDVAAGVFATPIRGDPPRIGKVSEILKLGNAMLLGLVTMMVRVVVAPPRVSVLLAKDLVIVGKDKALKLMLWLTFPTFDCGEPSLPVTIPFAIV